MFDRYDEETPSNSHLYKEARADEGEETEHTHEQESTPADDPEGENSENFYK